MDRQLASQFFEETSKAFAFLVREHGFSGPLLEVDDTIDFAYVTFMGTNLAIECILDVREADIDCKVVRIIDGKKAAHYAVDARGVKVREGLASLLRRRGVRERLFAPVSRRDLPDRVKVTLQDFAQMLRNYGQAILANSPEALT